jgi:hypothetical protein
VYALGIVAVFHYDSGKLVGGKKLRLGKTTSSKNGDII